MFAEVKIYVATKNTFKYITIFYLCHVIIALFLKHVGSGRVRVRSYRSINGTFLAAYSTRIVSDKMDMGKILFLLGHRV
jgi:hypothetical protein